MRSKTLNYYKQDCVTTKKKYSIKMFLDLTLCIFSAFIMSNWLVVKDKSGQNWQI